MLGRSKMRKLITLFLYFFLILSKSIVAISAEDFTLNKRIILNKDNLNPDDQIRVMLYTSKFSIYPQLNQPATFIQAPASGDPLASLVGAFIAVALINESNKSDRDSAINFNKDLNNALISININEELKLAIQTELSENDSFKKLEFEELTHINELAQAGLITKIEEKTILTLATRVHFDAQLKSLCFETNAKIWRKNETKPLYFTELSYSSAYLQESNKGELKKIWTLNNGELLIAKIKEGIADISHMLAKDISLNHQLVTDTLKATPIKTINTTTNKEMQTTLFVVEEFPNRLIGRLGSPESSLLTSIPKTNITLK